MNNDNPFKTLKFPELHKLTIPSIDIDKDKIPQEKAQWTKEDTAELSRSLLESLTTPCLVEEGDNKDYTEWVNKLTDDEAIDIASKIANTMLCTKELKKENLALIPEVTLDQLDKMSKGEKNEPPEIVESFGVAGDITLGKDDNGNNVVESINPKSFSPLPKLLSSKIKERLCSELGIGEMPDDLETQVHMCKTWLKTKDFFQLPVEEMYDWQVILLTTSALSRIDLITSKDVEEASKDYETMLNNFKVFGKPE